MSDSGMGFGGFLLGLGGGWFIFKYVTAGVDTLSYLLILVGAGIIINALLTKGRRKSPIQGLFGGVVGGLFLALFITQGFGIVTQITDEFTDIGAGTYRATKTFTLDTPVTAERVTLRVVGVNGGIELYPWSGDHIKLDLEIRAKGGTTAEAEAALTRFKHKLDDEMSGGTQMVTLTFPIASSEWNKYAAFVEAYIPEDVLAEVNLETTNGEISVHDLTLLSLVAETTNGKVELSNIESQTVDVETTNGGITGTITSSSTSLSTTNGGIDVTLGESSGEHQVTTTTGSIDLNLPTGSGVGYSLRLDTSVGSVSVNLPNISYEVDKTRSKIGETEGYATKETKIRITAETTIGSIKLN